MSSLLPHSSNTNLAARATSNQGRAPIVEQQPATGPDSTALPISTRRLALAFAVAAVSDVLSAVFTLVEPVAVVIDLGTSAVLFTLLGWRWALLPALVAEAVPGLSAFPTWFLVVAVIARRNKHMPSR